MSTDGTPESDCTWLSLNRNLGMGYHLSCIFQRGRHKTSKMGKTTGKYYVNPVSCSSLPPWEMLAIFLSKIITYLAQLTAFPQEVEGWKNTEPEVRAGPLQQFTVWQWNLHNVYSEYITPLALYSSSKLSIKFRLISSANERTKQEKKSQKCYNMLNLIGFSVLNQKNERNIRQNMPKC